MSQDNEKKNEQRLQNHAQTIPNTHASHSRSQPRRNGGGLFK